MNNKDLYKETVKTFLASIKIAWQIDPKLWRNLVLNPKFWEKVSHQLEEITAWNEQDDILMSEIIAHFKKETASLSLDDKLIKLDELLRGGWKNAKEYAEIKQKIKKLTDQINNKSAESE